MKKIGIHVNAEQLQCAIFDEQNAILDRFETVNDRTVRAQDNLQKVVDYIEGHKDGCAGIGLSFPGPLDIPNGKVLNPPNLAFGWANFRIVQYLEAVTGLPVVMTKDGNAEGLAEAVYGAGRGYENIYYIRITTGIGGGFIYKGKIVTGAHSSAAEIYDMVVNEDPHTHNGINAGSLNEQASIRGIEILAEEQLGRPANMEEILELYREGNPAVVKIIENAEEVLARGIANIGFVIDPDVFVISGTLGKAADVFIRDVTERVKKYWIHPDSLKILPAKIGKKDAGLIGAALLLEQE